MATVKSPRRLWFTIDRTRVVEDGDPEAAFLFCAPGQEVAVEELEKYGIAFEEAGKKSVAPAEDKAAKPTGTKAK